MYQIKKSVDRPENGVFIRRLILYAIIMGVMLFGASSIFEKFMSPMAVDGLMKAWYVLFVPVTALMMLIGLFRAWRRRWPMSYMLTYQSKARDNGFTTCPRCGARLIEKSRTRSSRDHVGDKITTTTYSDGTKSTHTEGIYETRSHSETYHECSNTLCQLVVEQHLSQSHYPWKKSQIRALVCNDSTGLRGDNRCAKHLLTSRLLIPILALVIIAVGAYSVYNYADAESNPWTHTEKTHDAKRTEAEFENELMGLDGQYAYYSVTFDKEKMDFLNRLGETRVERLYIEYYKSEAASYMIYTLKGNDRDTGLPDGTYILTTVDGAPVLVDDDNEIIYKKESDFYKKYADKLRAITHDGVLKELMTAVNADKAEHAIECFGSLDEYTEYIKSENAMVWKYITEDADLSSGTEFEGVINYPDKLQRDRYFFGYRSETSYLPEFEGYTTK